ncbi:1-aminocyclopropane-1-carboxylate deaminase/D-cysteine desulfhydrase [Arcicella rosea]|uniref:1-aminocyclopropane-1-carboxylate deaminase n=1 Tax=Arcicella rosea TaxID=502909 RepID=A0A841ES87_9BACT|nr:pyridoxal-phosphate dependent enzyme [Arcicella rosea]MBB6003110.1 1-aminocyclopropane-1-carboxylate deaminase [Arcicella rosea]
MFQLPHSPLTLIKDAVLASYNIKLYIKRDDLIHPTVTGNKWRKLKFNLIEAKEKGFDQLLTFGGAYSNHIYATAAAGKEFGFKTVGIIRGDELTPDSNDTLRYAHDCGMELIFVTRLDYNFRNRLTRQYGEKFYVLPEGGTNDLAIKGVNEMVDEIYEVIDPDFICSAVGTGGTLAGIVSGVRGTTKAIGFASLKGKGLLKGQIEKLLPFEKEFELNEQYHFDGYAKTTPELIEFIKGFEERNNGIQLEQVYTGKMMFGIYDLIKQGYFPENSNIVAVHTGGLQGRSEELK